MTSVNKLLERNLNRFFEVETITMSDGTAVDIVCGVGIGTFKHEFDVCKRISSAVNSYRCQATWRLDLPITSIVRREVLDTSRGKI